MKSYVTDTQALIWHMMQSHKLSSGARRAFRDAEQGMAQILVPTIVLVESAFIFARNRIPEDILDCVFALSDERDANFRIVPLDLAVAHAVLDFGPAAVPEISDRIIAATARAYDLPLLTADETISESELVQIIW
jgi:PIN domain nuclease of toxin-antitoxin system